MRAAFPEGVSAPVQYGERIAAFVLYLLHYQLLPEKRLATLMADLFGVKLVTATIRISQDCAERFQRFADALRYSNAVLGEQRGHDVCILAVVSLRKLLLHILIELLVAC
jgi:transposase